MKTMVIRGARGRSAREPHRRAPLMPPLCLLGDSPTSVVLPQGQFCPQGTLPVVMFLVVTLGRKGRSYGHRVGRGQGCCHSPNSTQHSPPLRPTKNDPAQMLVALKLGNPDHIESVTPTFIQHSKESVQ